MEIIENKHNAYSLKVQKAKDYFFEFYNKNKKISITATADSLGVTRQTLHNWIKQINDTNRDMQ
jgi:transposase-like protein